MTSLDEALQRIHQTGPEFDGWLSNHAPMVVEAMVRHDHGAAVHAWFDGYLARLEEPPRGLAAITDETWRDALGDHRRLADWLGYLLGAAGEQPWRQLLATWWPRLLPGIAAGATHGVIRVGHAVASLRDQETPTRVAELAHALAYWAARWQPVPMAPPGGRLPSESSPTVALRQLPRITDQDGGIRRRLKQLADMPQWTQQVAALIRPDPRHPGRVALIPDRLAEVVAAATAAYLDYERAGGIMLIHAATAPQAVLRTLPELPHELWPASFDAAWMASAAVFSGYASRRIPDPLPAVVERAATVDPREVFARAVAHGDEHVIKLADTALAVHAYQENPVAVASALHAISSVAV